MVALVQSTQFCKKQILNAEGTDSDGTSRKLKIGNETVSRSSQGNASNARVAGKPISVTETVDRSTAWPGGDCQTLNNIFLISNFLKYSPIHCFQCWGQMSKWSIIQGKSNAMSRCSSYVVLRTAEPIRNRAILIISKVTILRISVCA